MPAGNSTGKPLRLGGLIRVSGEAQERKGESLRVQRQQIEHAADLLGVAVTAWYGGQEHATEGWERKELKRLTAAVACGAIDAPILANATRWDRGSEEAAEAKKVFKAKGAPIFIGTTKYDLRVPEHELFLDMSSAFGKFDASSRRKASLLSRIKRAKDGKPSVGELPFGRTYDRQGGAWGIDPAKQALIADVAARYLAGERLYDLAREHGINHSGLCRVLRRDCGPEWVLDFNDSGLDIHEAVTLTVPRLLDEATVKRVVERMKARRNHARGRDAHDYLLSGRVFCAACGYAMIGQPSVGNGRTGRRWYYYRHQTRYGGAACPLRPRPMVRADVLDVEVVNQLHRLFGNPVEIDRAIRSAVPDCDKLLKRKEHLEGKLAGIARARSRVLGLIERDAITDAQAEGKLLDLKGQEGALRGEAEGLAAQLAELPDEAQLRKYVEAVPGFVFVKDEAGNYYKGGNDLATLLGMTQEDKRRLIAAVFDSPLPGGAPAGVYIERLRPPVAGSPEEEYAYSAPTRGAPAVLRPKRWGYTIKGRLDFECVLQNTRRWP
jgi:hypothetical protein